MYVSCHEVSTSIIQIKFVHCEASGYIVVLIVDASEVEEILLVMVL